MLALALSFSTTSTAGTEGVFSKNAVSVDGGKAHVVDRAGVALSVIWVDAGSEGFPAVLRVTAGGRHMEQPFDFGLNVAVLWSPDPHRFAITGSSQGANGQYRTAVVDVTPTGLKWTDLAADVERRFGHPVRCGWPEAPNVAAVTWLSGTRVVLAAQIIEHSNCDSAGTFKAYVFDLTTRRLGPSISQLDAKRRWASRLGVGLVKARDECIRSPSVCFVPANHVVRE